MVNDRQLKEYEFLLLNEKLKREARKSFYKFCQLNYPNIYKPDRLFLKDIAETLEKAYRKELINPNTGKPYRKIKIHLPPRHYKTFTVTNFSSWALGDNPSNRIISISYNEILSQRLGKQTRDIIDAPKFDPAITVYNDIFEKTNINKKDSSKQIWSLEGQFFNFLSSSPNATTTGIGGNIIIIDDLIKDAYEATNPRILDEHWDWFVNTFQSRFENDPLIIIVMTRWSTKDIAGRLEKEQPGEWLTVLYEAYNEAENKMLCEDIKSLDDYLSHKKLSMGSNTSYSIFLANYHQQAVDIQGYLYKTLIEHELPKDYNFKEIIAVLDPAGQGKDDLCLIISGIGRNDNLAYILDVYLSDADVDITAPECAKRLTDFNVNRVNLESNDLKGYYRTLKNELAILKNTKTVLVPYHQALNKEAKIKGNAGLVTQHVRFPFNWKYEFKDFHERITTFQSKGKNLKDDAADALTELVLMLLDLRVTDYKALNSIELKLDIIDFNKQLGL